MITCEPTGIFSWNYTILLEDGSQASVKFSSFRERAEIHIPRQDYQIIREGFINARWNLLQDGQCVATAYKPNALFRSYSITSDELSFDLAAASAFTRTFEMISNSTVIGTITPTHLFTRWTTIDCSARIPIQFQLFSLVLAALAWRRSARSRNS